MGESCEAGSQKVTRGKGVHQVNEDSDLASVLSLETQSTQRLATTYLGPTEPQEVSRKAAAWLTLAAHHQKSLRQ